MGIFGKSEKLLSVARGYAHSANESNKEIGEVLEKFDLNFERFKSISTNFGSYSMSIKDKLDVDELKEMTSLLDELGDFYQEFAARYSDVMSLSENQMKRTTEAISIYEKISS